MTVIKFVKRPNDPTVHPAPNPRRPEAGHQNGLRAPEGWHWQGQEVQQYFFAIPSSRPVLQGLCDKFLNYPSDGKCSYRVSAPYVLMFFAFNDRMSLRHGETQMSSFFQYKECSLWIPTRRQDQAGEVAALFPYYLFVDRGSYPMIATTREGNGWPSEPAEVEFPLTGVHAKEFTTKVVLLDRFSPDTRATSRLLIKLTKEAEIPALAPPEREARTAENQRWQEKLDRLGSRMFLEQYQPPVDEQAILPKLVRFAFLKQFRDTSHPHRACYQAGVESQAQTDTTKFHYLPARYRLDIPDADSHPLVAELGLRRRRFGEIYGAFSHINTTVTLGQELWHNPP